MIVVDASALTEMLAFAGERGEAAARALGRDVEWCAPAHWSAEVFSAIRGLTLGGQLSDAAGRQAVARIPRLTIDGVGLEGLMGQMWALRPEISGYDSAYVALARLRCLTLVTADGRLARAAVRHCRVEALH
ncbi:type II toxin-antitoxin system VapC family toxin [Nocardioidaceae bacterium SCSIO 66511]|nr:type II toxin-antitoxin system VapC family toxin [Nocardioidaceae bacterium SCSIO 66511]